MVFREAKRQGVQHMIATHAFDLAGKMTIEQMQEAAKLGAFIEFDYRNTLEGGRMDAIRKVGPEYCFLSEFWTKVTAPKEYAGLEGVGAFAEAMRAQGFTDQRARDDVQGEPGKGARPRAVDDRRGAVTDLPLNDVRHRPRYDPGNPVTPAGPIGRGIRAHTRESGGTGSPGQAGR